MTRHKLGDATILMACVVGALVSTIWGLGQAPREYGLLAVVLAVGAVLMAIRLFRGAAQ